MGRHFKPAAALLAAFILLASWTGSSAALAAEVGESVGSIITFGRYEQDHSTADGAEPIEWIVLSCDAESGKALLISRYVLEARCFDSAHTYPTWEKSEIRAWLNDEFLNTAFTAQERENIVLSNLSTPAFNGNDGGADTLDAVFLLSRDEAQTYFADDRARQTVPTWHATANGAWQSQGYKKAGKGCCWWWLRSPGGANEGPSYVDTDGSVDCIIGGWIPQGCVRPAVAVKVK